MKISLKLQRAVYVINETPFSCHTVDNINLNINLKCQLKLIINLARY